MDKRLIGEWNLVKIEDSLKTLLPPKSTIYFLNVSDSTFNFSIGINTCDLYGVKTINGKISNERSGLCTEICCDKDIWPFFYKINYQGYYRIKDDGNLLVIENKDGKLYLKKKQKRLPTKNKAH